MPEAWPSGLCPAAHDPLRSPDSHYHQQDPGEQRVEREVDRPSHDSPSR